MKGIGQHSPWSWSGLQRFVDIRPGEARRILLMGVLLFFLLAANNVIKIVRDALFLSRFPIAQLPYVYLLAALVAGVVIVTYSRYTTRLSLARVILGSLLVTIASVICFWFLVVFYGGAWVFYAYYIWSAIAGMILVAQFWILANGLFTARDGKRLFGVITAGGTLGALLGGIAANWVVSTLFGSKHLLWLVVGLLVGAFAAAGLALRESAMVQPQGEPTRPPDVGSALGIVRDSRYLQIIAALIFVSVVVSTLIDYQFKAAAKAAYPSADALAGFFGSYYAWLGAFTLLAQLWITGRVLVAFGLTPSLLVLPAALCAGSLGLLVWPGLAAATATRMAEATLRTSVNQSGVQILYLPIGEAIKKKVKVFLDVTIERLGDATAALLILFGALVWGASNAVLLSVFSLGLIGLWLLLVSRAQRGYVDALRTSLVARDLVFEGAPIDFSDRATLEAVLKHFDTQDEAAVLFALDLAERMDRSFAATRLPLSLLQHDSAEVRRRAVALAASALEPKALAAIFAVLTSANEQIRADAAGAIADVLRKSGAASAPQLPVAGTLQGTQAGLHGDALARLRELLADRSADGEKNRLDAVRWMGEQLEPEFGALLSEVVREDPAPAVVHEAMAAAARAKYPSVIQATIAKLGASATKKEAREALVQYGEMAVKALRNALSDDRVARETRLNVPRTLSKIHAQTAMNALMAGLLEEDRALRFQAILAAEEMNRRFADLKVDRDVVESAILSDAQLYCRRLVIYSELFGDAKDAPTGEPSLLYHALRESMARVLERVMWLLALIYPAQDIRRAWAALHAADARQRAHATELIENLLKGDIKNYLLPLYGDKPADERLRAALDVVGIMAPDGDAAFHALLEQEDRWLKAAALWEIGIRKIKNLREAVAALTRSDDPLLCETAGIVLQRL